MSCDCDYILDRDVVEERHYQGCRSLVGDSLRNANGTLRLVNKHLLSLDVDVLYHFGLDTQNYDLPAMFGDIKFVCMGGTKDRMRDFAVYIARVLGLVSDEKMVNISKHSRRFAMYKVGPVLSVSHGIGISSMTTALQELFKLMYYAKAKDPIFFRIGTSGGLGIPAGSVVVSSWGLNGTLEKSYEVPVLGKMRKTSSYLDRRLSQELQYLSSGLTEFKTVIGGTMGTDDFYRGQARLDGPFCDYTKADKMAFLNQLWGMGVKNIEMEANAYAAFTIEAGVRAGIVCVTLLDRFQGDQVTPPKQVLNDWQKRPMMVVGKLIQEYVKRNQKSNET